MITTLKEYKALPVTKKPIKFRTIEFKSICLNLAYHQDKDGDTEIVAVFYQNVMLPMDVISDDTYGDLTVKLESEVKDDRYT